MKKKKFDCVQMKWDIQQKLMKEFAGLSPQEIEKIAIERMLANPAMAKFWKKSKHYSEKKRVA